MSQRGLRNDETFEQLVRALERDFPRARGPKALDNLATFYIQQDRDDEADAVLRECTRASRAAVTPSAQHGRPDGALSQGRHERGDPVFELAAASFPRSDYRPSWPVLVWPRARCDGRCCWCARSLSATIADYHNTYYGRLAEGILRKQGGSLGRAVLCLRRARQRSQPRMITFRRPRRRFARCSRPGSVRARREGARVPRAKWGDSPASPRPSRGQTNRWRRPSREPSSSRSRAARSHR